MDHSKYVCISLKLLPPPPWPFPRICSPFQKGIWVFPPPPNSYIKNLLPRPSRRHIAPTHSSCLVIIRISLRTRAHCVQCFYILITVVLVLLNHPSLVLDHFLTLKISNLEKAYLTRLLAHDEQVPIL